MPRLENSRGEALYYNVVEKNGKIQYVLKGIGSTVILGRDKQRRRSRIFTQEAQAEQYLRRHGFEVTYSTSGRRRRATWGGVAGPPGRFFTCPPKTTPPIWLPLLFFPKEKTGPFVLWVVCLYPVGVKGRYGPSTGQTEGKAVQVDGIFIFPLAYTATGWYNYLA